MAEAGIVDQALSVMCPGRCSLTFPLPCPRQNLPHPAFRVVVDFLAAAAVAAAVVAGSDGFAARRDENSVLLRKMSKNVGKMTTPEVLRRCVYDCCIKSVVFLYLMCSDVAVKL